jgi:hypothetical protein
MNFVEKAWEMKTCLNMAQNKMDSEDVLIKSRNRLSRMSVKWLF